MFAVLDSVGVVDVLVVALLVLLVVYLVRHL